MVATAVLQPAHLRDVTIEHFLKCCKVGTHPEVKEHFQHLFYGSDRADYRSRQRIAIEILAQTVYR